MTEVESNTTKSNTQTISDELTWHIANLLKNGLGNQPSNEINTETFLADFKLNHDNCLLLACLIKKAIEGKGKAECLIGVSPEITDPSFVR